MILPDTSVWVDHLRMGDPDVEGSLERTELLGHPWVIGELALGHIANREEVLTLLARLPRATVASDAEVLRLIDAHRLHGSGIGFVDAQLLAATRLTPDALLWTRDKRLRTAAAALGCDAGRR